MPFGGLLTGGLIAGGATSSVIGGKDAASAQQGIAQAQMNQQGLERNYAMQIAQPTQYDISALQEQLANYQNTYNLQGAQIQQQTQLQQTLNPQLNQLLQGQNAPTLNPYLNIVATQKNQLQSDLARQLGPGWENTTAGQQALQNFNLQSANQGAQIQQNYLGSMMGENLALNSSLAGQINQGGMTLNSISQGIAGGSNAIQNRQISASEGTSLVPYSGAGYVGQLGQANMLSGIGGSLMGMGSSVGTAGMMGAFKGGGGGGESSGTLGGMSGGYGGAGGYGGGYGNSGYTVGGAYGMYGG